MGVVDGCSFTLIHSLLWVWLYSHTQFAVGVALLSYTVCCGCGFTLVRLLLWVWLYSHALVVGVVNGCGFTLIHLHVLLWVVIILNKLCLISL